MNYGILARYYDALVKDDEATRQWVNWIGRRGRTPLDCACGSGEITRRLAGMYEQTAGMDLSPDMIRPHPPRTRITPSPGLQET